MTTVEIMGYDLGTAMHTLKVEAERVWATGRPDDLEVWKLEEAELAKLESVSWYEWDTELPGWYRKYSPIMEQLEVGGFMVNGQPMNGYLLSTTNQEKFFDRFYTWAREVLKIKELQQVATVAISMAKLNNMSVAEFMRTFQDGTRELVNGHIFLKEQDLQYGQASTNYELIKDGKKICKACGKSDFSEHCRGWDGHGGRVSKIWKENGKRWNE